MADLTGKIKDILKDLQTEIKLLQQKDPGDDLKIKIKELETTVQQQKEQLETLKELI